MAEHRDSTRSDSLRRVVIDWAAVAGLIFDWLIAVGEFVFSVLLFGLAGGYFGQFVDFGLYFVREDWVGRGREWGWVLGAVSAAIGLPVGWARVDGRKFSFPSPRKLRKKISGSVRQRRKKKTTTYEFRNAGHVLKGGGLLGLIGAIVGFFLGGALVMCWFSLTMSPLAPVDWFASLEFDAKAEDDYSLRHDEDRRGAISTDNPLPIYLWFSPILVLGGLGAVVGLVYGTAQYVDYLSSVPADLRAKARQKAREPVVEKSEAAAAAIEQGLPSLAPAPRWVPLQTRWQLLRGGVGLGLVVGVLFFVAGLIFAPLLVLGWRHNPSEVPLVAVTFAVIFLAVGLAIMAACFHHWRRNVTILRRGYLAKCRIVQCRDPQSGKWKPYEAVLDELRAAWDKPIAAFNTSADTKGFQRFMTFGGWFALFVFTFMGVVGVLLTGAIIHMAVVQREALAWFGLLFVAAWWFILVAIARIFLRAVPLLKTVGKQSLKTLGIEPIVECRAQFTLPGDKAVDFETKLDLSRRLAPDSADPVDVAIYDPLQPSRALLLSGFQPALAVGEAGELRFAAAP